MEVNEDQMNVSEEVNEMHEMDAGPGFKEEMQKRRKLRDERDQKAAKESRRYESMIT